MSGENELLELISNMNDAMKEMENERTDDSLRKLRAKMNFGVKDLLIEIQKIPYSFQVSGLLSLKHNMSLLCKIFFVQHRIPQITKRDRISKVFYAVIFEAPFDVDLYWSNFNEWNKPGKMFLTNGEDLNLLSWFCDGIDYTELVNQINSIPNEYNVGRGLFGLLDKSRELVYTIIQTIGDNRERFAIPTTKRKELCAVALNTMCESFCVNEYKTQHGELQLSNVGRAFLRMIMGCVDVIALLVQNLEIPPTIEVENGIGGLIKYHYDVFFDILHCMRPKNIMEFKTLLTLTKRSLNLMNHGEFWWAQKRMSRRIWPFHLQEKIPYVWNLIIKSPVHITSSPNDLESGSFFMCVYPTVQISVPIAGALGMGRKEGELGMVGEAKGSEKESACAVAISSCNTLNQSDVWKVELLFSKIVPSNDSVGICSLSSDAEKRDEEISEYCKGLGNTCTSCCFNSSGRFYQNFDVNIGSISKGFSSSFGMPLDRNLKVDSWRGPEDYFYNVPYVLGMEAHMCPKEEERHLFFFVNGRKQPVYYSGIPHIVNFGVYIEYLQRNSSIKLMSFKKMRHKGVCVNEDICRHDDGDGSAEKAQGRDGRTSQKKYIQKWERARMTEVEDGDVKVLWDWRLERDEKEFIGDEEKGEEEDGEEEEGSEGAEGNERNKEDEEESEEEEDDED